MSRSNLVLALVFVANAAALAPAFAAGSIVLRTEYPTEGEAIELFVQNEAGEPVAGAEVTVTYRPGSSVTHEAVVGTTGADGRVRWVPETAGIAALFATWNGDGSASINVSVRFGSTPLGGVLIMVVAGLLLVGGSVVRLARVARSGA